MFLLYGWSLIACVMVFLALARAAVRELAFDRWWRGSYFYLVAGVALVELAFAEFSLVKVIQIFGSGPQFAQPQILGLLAAGTALNGTVLMLVSLAMNSRAIVLLFIALAASWWMFGLVGGWA